VQDWLPIDTARLQLRRFRPGDAPRLAAYRADPVLARYQGWSALSVQEAGDFVREMQDQPAFVEQAWLQVAIARRSDDVLIGDIGLCLHGAGTLEVGFTLERAAHGQGLATEALRALFSALQGHAAVTQIIAICDERNAACLRVLRRLGMRLTGSEQALFKGQACTELHYRLDPAAA
jgi:RimJ/RimL family protein N-acetyltransferase